MRREYVTAIRLQETVGPDPKSRPRSTTHGLRSRPCFVNHCEQSSSTMAKATPTKSNDFYAIQTSQKDAEDRTRIQSVWLASIVPNQQARYFQHETKCFNMQHCENPRKQTRFQRSSTCPNYRNNGLKLSSPVRGIRISSLMSGQPPQT